MSPIGPKHLAAPEGSRQQGQECHSSSQPCPDELCNTVSQSVKWARILPRYLAGQHLMDRLRTDHRASRHLMNHRFFTVGMQLNSQCLCEAVTGPSTEYILLSAL